MSAVVFQGQTRERLGATQNNIDSFSQLHHQESTPRITILPAMQAKNSATELFFGNKRHKFVKKKKWSGKCKLFLKQGGHHFSKQPHYFYTTLRSRYFRNSCFLPLHKSRFFWLTFHFSTYILTYTVINKSIKRHHTLHKIIHRFFEQEFCHVRIISADKRQTQRSSLQSSMHSWNGFS